MSYRLTENPRMVLRVADGVWIPDDARNGDYAEYTRWLAAGNVPEPYVPPPPAVPAAVSAFQARASLHLAGLLPTVEAMIADAGTPTVVRLAWEYGTEVRRDSPTVAAMATALGWTEAQLDALFIDALGIEA